MGKKRLESRDHKHISDKNAIYYINMQDYLVMSGKAVEDLRNPLARRKYNKIHDKISFCGECSGILSKLKESTN